MNNSLKKNRKGPELLAPAGDYQAFLGAINAGADAVYLAAEAYGARAYAKNFTKEEILSALHYAHIHDAAIYLTVNTLTKDAEGEGLRDLLALFYFAGLDGVIVQDLGVMSYIREVFPDLPIHVSTQATVTSKEGAQFYQEFGATRVVPARELTLPEIKEIISLGIETECFIHGSMCYSYSGQCLFSSYLGGRSGNRGRCAGPCRQQYCVRGAAFERECKGTDCKSSDSKTNKGKKDRGQRSTAGGAENEAYVLSLKDMCTIEILPELIDAGITSFKIEGRMKSPAYAAGVTAIYRKYIDKYLANPSAEYKVDPKDLANLKNLYLRTDLQRGYYEKTKDKSMVSITSPSYNKTDEELSAALIDKYCRKKVPVSIPAKITFATGKEAALEFSYKGETYSLTGDKVLAAQKSPLAKDDLIVRFAKSSEGLFSFEIAEAEVSADAFLPMGSVNALRRKGVETLSDHIDDEYLTRRVTDDAKFASDCFANDNYIDSNICETNGKNKEESGCFTENNTCMKVFISNAAQAETVWKFASESTLKTELVIPYGLFDSFVQTSVTGPEIYLELPYILRSGNRDSLRETILRAEELSHVKGYYVNQMDQYLFLRNLGVGKEIIGNLNLYVINSRARDLVLQYLDGFTCAVESSAKEIRDILGAQSRMGHTDSVGFGAAVPAEVFFYGRVPLMQTANCVKRTLDKCDKTEGYFTLEDRMHARFPIYSHCNEKVCYNTIYNSVPLSLHKHAHMLLDAGIRVYQLHFTNEQPKEVRSVLLLCQDVLTGNEAKKVSYEFTNGHFVKGVL